MTSPAADGDDARPTTAIDGSELRELVAQARDGRAALAAQLAAAPRATEAIAPIGMILDRPLKLVDEVRGRKSKIMDVGKFRSTAPAAAVVAALDAALAAGTQELPRAAEPVMAPAEDGAVVALELDRGARRPRIAPLRRAATGVAIAAPPRRLDVYVLAALLFVLGAALWVAFS